MELSNTAMGELLYGYSMDQLKGVDRDAIRSVMDGMYIKSKNLLTNGTHTTCPAAPSELDRNGVRDPQSIAEIDVTGVASMDPSAMNGSTPRSQTQTNEGPHQQPTNKVMPIAIVGMSCRFPGGTNSLQELRRLCMEGTSPWSEVPKCRFNADAFYHPNAERVDSVGSDIIPASDVSNTSQMNVKSGHFLKEDQYGYFDASFFNISPNEARVCLLVSLSAV